MSESTAALLKWMNRCETDRAQVLYGCVQLVPVEVDQPLEIVGPRLGISIPTAFGDDLEVDRFAASA